MNVPVIAFFNNKGGVGKTTLVYHLSWMFAELGRRVLAADLDPQANLTSAFIDERRQESLFEDEQVGATLFDCVHPLIRGTGDVKAARPVSLSDSLRLVPGDLQLSIFEDQLSDAWPKCLDGDERSFRVVSSFWRVLQVAAAEMRGDLILMDLGPNLGALNRAALVSADYLVIPLAPDVFSLQGLRNLGPRVRAWRNDWSKRRAENPSPSLPLPTGQMRPVGYIVLQHAVRLDRPVRAYEKWMARIPGEYWQSVLQEPPENAPTVAGDPNCLALLKNYRSLIPLAQEAHKPIFFLRPADGALGGHENAARAAHTDFKTLAENILIKSVASGDFARS